MPARYRLTIEPDHDTPIEARAALVAWAIEHLIPVLAAAPADVRLKLVPDREPEE